MADASGLQAGAPAEPATGAAFGALPASAGDAPPAVLGDLTCISCGYNLRTLHFDARCPECGTPIARSIPAETPTDVDRGWLRGVIRGLALFLAAIALPILALIILGLIGGLLPFSSDRTWFAAWVALVATDALLVRGLWLVARCEPAATAETETFEDDQLRVLAFISAATMLIIGLTWHPAGGLVALLLAVLLLLIPLLKRLAAILLRLNPADLLAEAVRDARKTVMAGFAMLVLALLSLLVALGIVGLFEVVTPIATVFAAVLSMACILGLLAWVIGTCTAVVCLVNAAHLLRRHLRDVERHAAAFGRRI